MDNDADIANFLQQYGYTVSILRDTDGNLARNWGVNWVPNSFFIDASGIIRKVTTGTFDNAAQIKDILNSY
jgi:peroxiredoxin